MQKGLGHYKNIDGYNWDASCWPTHDKMIRFLKIKFRTQHHTVAIKDEMEMSKPFINFAKAYIHYTQHLKPTKTFPYTVLALQLLEESLTLLETTPCVTKITSKHFDKACDLISKHGYGGKDSIGSALERISRNISNWNLTTTNLKHWQHPFKGHFHNSSKRQKIQISKSKKLPDDDAILAIAEMFANGYHEAQDDETTFISCITCLLLSAPMRISEILWYRKDLIQEEKDSHGESQFYLSYWVPKNERYVRKEIPSVMAAHAKESVKRLKSITEEGRRLAIHYESGSSKFYRHPNCPNVPDNQILTANQVISALGLRTIQSAYVFIESITGKRSLKNFTLNSLWELVLKKHKQLNPYFPYQQRPSITNSSKSLKMSESLLCFRYMQFSTKLFNPSPILLAPINSNFYRLRTNQSNGMKMNIFRKHGYGDLKLSSHQLRHFLNTMGQEAGVGIEQITQWSTRASSSQTRVYMHQDPRRKAQRIALELTPTEMTNIKNPISQDEYKIMMKGPIITKRYGICSHDYTLTPCQKHADCLNCSELLLCKGHLRSIAAIRQERDRVAENLYAAKALIDTGERVANRWYNSHLATVNRIDQLLRVMEDDSIVDGSPIQMQGNDFSHEIRIITSKSENKNLTSHTRSVTDMEYGDELIACLKILQDEINE